MAGIMIAAPSSGSGKTMITCGLLTLLKEKGISPWAFKCGPDYIDGLFHRQVLGIEGGNLDSFFSSEEQLKESLSQAEKNHFVVAEGVMGYFDGLGGNSAAASTYEVAAITGIPAVLVVDAKGSSLSLAAQIQGFLNFKVPGSLSKGLENNGIRAVIFNRMSSMLYPKMKALTEELTGIRAAGYVPELPSLTVKSRHLGLVLPEEIEDLQEQLHQLAATMEETIDWKLLMELGETGTQSICPPAKEPVFAESSFKLAVARDEAFCFYYRDNLELLKQQGAELVFFSPLSDKKLPEGIGGLLLGGGYPENAAKQLSDNTAMRREIFKLAEEGLPILAECGGYLYLLKELEGSDKESYPMCGILPGKGYRKGKNGHFGYLFLEPFGDTPYLKQGEQVRGHEFHYWDCEVMGEAYECMAKKPSGGRSWHCMQIKNRVMAGFPHLYYPSCPQLVSRFGDACRQFLKERSERCDL